jgi:predicted transcriptional regulator
MLKECLKSLEDKKLNLKNLNVILENYDEEQLEFMMTYQGLMLNKTIMINYHPGKGFYCSNVDAPVKGNNPLCKLIERYLNSNMSGLIKESYDNNIKQNLSAIEIGILNEIYKGTKNIMEIHKNLNTERDIYELFNPINNLMVSGFIEPLETYCYDLTEKGKNLMSSL